MLNEGNSTRETIVDVVSYTVDKEIPQVSYKLKRYILDDDGAKHEMQEGLLVIPDSVTVDETQAEIDWAAQNPIP